MTDRILSVFYNRFFPTGDQAARIINLWSRNAQNRSKAADPRPSAQSADLSSTSRDTSASSTEEGHVPPRAPPSSSGAEGTEPRSETVTSGSRRSVKPTGWGFLGRRPQWPLMGSSGRPGTWWQSLWHHVELHHFMMLILMVAITLLALLLAGCTTEGLKNVYILSLSYTNRSTTYQGPTQLGSNISAIIVNLTQNATNVEIRIGYFGICLLDRQLDSTVCSSSISTLALVLRDTAGSTDPLNLLSVAQKFHDATIFSGLIFIAIIFALISTALLSTFPVWHDKEDSDGGSGRQVKSFPSRPVTTVALACTVIATFFASMSAFWQHLSAAATISMMGSFAYGTASARVGAAAIAFGWLGAGLFALVVLAIGGTMVFFRLIFSFETDTGSEEESDPVPLPPEERSRSPGWAAYFQQAVPKKRASRSSLGTERLQSHSKPASKASGFTGAATGRRGQALFGSPAGPMRGEQRKRPQSYSMPAPNAPWASGAAAGPQYQTMPAAQEAWGPAPAMGPQRKRPQSYSMPAPNAPWASGAATGAQYQRMPARQETWGAGPATGPQRQEWHPQGVPTREKMAWGTEMGQQRYGPPPQGPWARGAMPVSQPASYGWPGPTPPFQNATGPG